VAARWGRWGARGRTVVALVRLLPGMRWGPSAVEGVGKVASVVAAALAGAAAAITIGSWPANAEWIPAWSALGILYLACGLALWRDRDWARALTLGVAGWGLGACIEASFALGPSSLTLVATLGHALLFGLVAILPDALPPRHRWSLTLAAAALPCALAFGFAPQHSLATTIVVVASALTLVAGTAGVARGRTWGLLLALVGAPAVAASVLVTPSTRALRHAHPILPHQNAVMIDVLGLCAAGLALAALVPFLGPIARFLRRE
jgi:hypothetical protein